MRKFAILAMTALFAVSSVAFAEGRGGPRGGGMKQKQEQQQAAMAASQSASGSGNIIDLSDRSSFRDEGDDIPVAQAWAAPLTSSNDTCMGSSSAGAQGASFGVSIATTWRDGDCVRRKDARLLHNMGLHGPAAALMCQKEAVRKAFEDAGVACMSPRVEEERAAEAARTIEIAPISDEGQVRVVDPNPVDGFAWQSIQ